MLYASGTTIPPSQQCKPRHHMTGAIECTAAMRSRVKLPIPVDHASTIHAGAKKSEMAAASYDYDFVGQPSDDLVCPICQSVAKHPLQHGGCGKLFCKQCLEEYGRDKPCPNCRKTGLPFYKDIRRESLQYS